MFSGKRDVMRGEKENGRLKKIYGNMDKEPEV